MRCGTAIRPLLFGAAAAKFGVNFWTHRRRAPRPRKQRTSTVRDDCAAAVALLT
jgi:hypothetical protein